MASSSEPNTASATKKPISRRPKIEIKRVEQKNRRHVTFSKRKRGLFNKVTELSILCQAETALIVFSQNGKLYTCGHPSPDAVVRRYLAGEQGSSRNNNNAVPPLRKHKDSVETLRQQYEDAQNMLKEEKTHLTTIVKARESGCYDPLWWWNQSVEDMGLEDLEQFKGSMEQLMHNLLVRTEEMRLNSLPSIPYSFMLN